MRDDIQSRRKTEIDFLNGAVVKAAHRLNIQTPVNQVLIQYIRQREEDFHQDSNKEKEYHFEIDQFWRDVELFKKNHIK